MQLTFEKGHNYSINVTHQINGILLNYEELLFDVSLERTDVESFLNRVSAVANSLHITQGTLLVEFITDLGTASCCVDEQNTIHLVLPVNIMNGRIILEDRDVGEDYLLYHEFMHAKEVLDGRFPSIGQIGPENEIEIIIGRLNDFANEGMLEAMNKPYIPIDDSIENIYQCLLENCEFGLISTETMDLLTREKIAVAARKVWGRKLVYAEAEAIANELLHN